MKIETFGRDSKDSEIRKITLENGKGMKAVVSDLGAVLLALLVPDRDGRPVDVVLGYEELSGYENNGCCFGATIGRCGNRVENAEFVLNGKKYEMGKSPNYRHNCHSTPDVFFTRKWDVVTGSIGGEEFAEFFLFSPDGDQGFPGNMKIRVRYTLTENNELQIDYYGLSDQDTVMNMTNHSYFNLNGKGDILGHRVRILADAVTEVDDELIPTGKLLSVEGTPFDFREEKAVGRDIDDPMAELQYGHGYDHSFVVNGGKVAAAPEKVAECEGDLSGIRMEVDTDLPGVQVYTANGLRKAGGKGGITYEERCGICFETQFAPNSVNLPQFAQPIIQAGRENHSCTRFRFV